MVWQTDGHHPRFPRHTDLVRYDARLSHRFGTVSSVPAVLSLLFCPHSARQPDGVAEAALLLGEYRKLDPSSLEEFLLFDHPSGRTRIYAAMRWKAENQCLGDAVRPCGR